MPIIRAILMTLSVLFGYTRFEFTSPIFLGLFIGCNLFLAVFNEEALCRGLLYNCPNISSRPMSALILNSIIFAIPHYLGGVKYRLLAFMAGFYIHLLIKKAKALRLQF